MTTTRDSSRKGVRARARTPARDSSRWVTKHFLHCPHCDAVMDLVLTADSKYGLYFEFIAVGGVCPPDTALAHIRTDAQSTPDVTGDATVVAYAEERGWDDDEAPFPTQVELVVE